jgi:hypothetical protein
MADGSKKTVRDANLKSEAGVTCSFRSFTLVSVVLAILTLFPLLQTGFTTHDDSRTALDAGNPANYFTQAFERAKYRGAFAVPISAFFGLVPYFVDSAAYYQAIKLGSILANFILFFVLVRFLFNSSAFAFFTTILAWCLIQNNWQHNLLTSYPFGFHFALSCLFFALFSFAKNSGAHESQWGLLSGLLFFLSMLIYEAFLAYVFIFIGLAIYIQFENGRSKKNCLAGINQLLLPISISSGIYLLLYCTFRWFYPSLYDGVILAPFSIIRIIRVLLQYSIGTFPTLFYLFDSVRINTTFDGFVPHRIGIISLFQQLRVEWLVKAIIASSSCWILLRSKQFIFSRASFLISIVFGFGFVVLPLIPIALTLKYQDWAINHSTVAYVPSYFSFFGTVFIISSIIFFLNQHMINRQVTATLYIIIVSIFVSLSSIMTDYYNFYVTLDQQLSHLKWVSFNLFLDTPEFKAVPDGSVLYAPTLGRPRGIVDHSHDPTYWSTYVRQKTGKLLVITNRREELRSVSGSGEPSGMYYLSYHQEPKDKNQFIVFAAVADPQCFQAKTVTIRTYGKYRKYTVIGTLLKNEGEASITVNDESLRAGAIGQGVFSHQVDNTLQSGPFPKTEIHSNVFLELENIALIFFPITFNFHAES